MLRSSVLSEFELGQTLRNTHVDFHADCFKNQNKNSQISLLPYARLPSARNSFSLTD